MEELVALGSLVEKGFLKAWADTYMGSVVKHNGGSRGSTESPSLLVTVSRLFRLRAPFVVTAVWIGIADYCSGRGMVYYIERGFSIRTLNLKYPLILLIESG